MGTFILGMIVGGMVVFVVFSLVTVASKKEDE